MPSQCVVWNWWRVHMNVSQCICINFILWTALSPQVFNNSFLMFIHPCECTMLWVESVLYSCYLLLCLLCLWHAERNSFEWVWPSVLINDVVRVKRSMSEFVLRKSNTFVAHMFKLFAIILLRNLLKPMLWSKRHVRTWQLAKLSLSMVWRYWNATPDDEYQYAIICVINLVRSMMSSWCQVVSGVIKMLVEYAAGLIA